MLLWLILLSACLCSPLPSLRRYIEPLSPLTFEERVSAPSESGYLVVFGAEWCRHSRAFAKTFERLYDSLHAHGGLVPAMGVYLLADPREDPLHRRFGVRGFPTLLFVRGGLYWTFEGEGTLPALEKWLDRILQGQGKRGSPYPSSPIPGWKELLGDVGRDFEYTLRTQANENPVGLLLAGTVVLGSLGVVLYILLVLLLDLCGRGLLYPQGQPKEDELAQIIRRSAPDPPTQSKKER